MFILIRSAIPFATLLSACAGTTVPPPDDEIEIGIRVGHAMAYDEARNHLLLFGGDGTEGNTPKALRGSLWRWDGAVWVRLATSGPPARRFASLVYDAARQRVVLYGGQSGSFPNVTVFTDTWEWDGSSWTKRADAGPPARVHQTMAYDRVRGRVVLFGGFDMANQNERRDIWEWNGTAWQQASVTIPAGGSAAGILHDEGTQATLLYYNADAGGSTLVASRYDGVALHPTSGAHAPPCMPTLLAAMGTSPGGGLLYTHGCHAAQDIQSHRWNGSAWTRVTGTQPGFRLGSAMAFDRARNRVVLFGGEVAAGVPDLGDTWEFDGTTWRDVTPDP